MEIDEAKAVAECVDGTIWDPVKDVCVEDTGSPLDGKCSTQEFQCLQGTVQNIQYGYGTDYSSWECVGENDTIDFCSYYTGGGGTTTTTGEVTLKAVPSWIFKGRSSTLSWTSWAGATCSLSDSNGTSIATETNISGDGHVDVKPALTTTYTMTCMDAVGTAETPEANNPSATATVRVIRPIIFER